MVALAAICDGLEIRPILISLEMGPSAFGQSVPNLIGQLIASPSVPEHNRDDDRRKYD